MKTTTYDETKWRLVPIDPTKEMLLQVETPSEYKFEVSAGTENAPVDSETAAEIYQAMLAATPPADGQVQQDYKALYHAEQKLRLEAEACADMLRGTQQDADKVDAQHAKKMGVHDASCMIEEVTAIADYIADNWPDRKFSLGEIESRVRTMRPKPDPAMAGDDLTDKEITKISYDHLHPYLDGDELYIEGRVDFARALLKRVQPASGDYAISDLIHSMFRSGNSVPVQRITVTRDQYDAAIQQERQP